MGVCVFVIIGVLMFLLENSILWMHCFTNLVWVLQQALPSHLKMLHVVIKQDMTKTIRLYNHSSKKHTVNIISYYECKICEYKTMNKYYLSDHTKRQHAGDDSNSFVCHMCYVRKPNCVTELKLYTLNKLSSTLFCCLCVSEGSVSPIQISTISIYTGIKALYWHSTT